MRRITLEQNSAEWRELRRSKVGASDIAILMTGTDREIYDLYTEKKGKERYETDAMRRGSEMEAEARRWYETEMGISFERPVGLHDNYDWLMASFDGLNYDLGLSLEIKCPNEIPDHLESSKNWKRYFYQVQAQLAVGGHEKAVLLAYSPTKRVSALIGRDEKAISDLIKQGEWFYDCIKNDKPPEYLEKRKDAAAKEFAEAAKILKNQLDELQEQWKILREGGIYLAGDVSFECDGVKVMKVDGGNTIDYKAALEKYCPNADLSAFTKSRPASWRLTVN